MVKKEEERKEGSDGETSGFFGFFFCTVLKGIQINVGARKIGTFFLINRGEMSPV